MKESDIETYLRDKTMQAGGLCLKFESPGFNGVPDRIVILNSNTVFVEVKAPGEKPRALQVKRIKQIKARGGKATFLDSKKAVDSLIEGLR